MEGFWPADEPWHEPWHEVLTRVRMGQLSLGALGARIVLNALDRCVSQGRVRVCIRACVGVIVCMG